MKNTEKNKPTKKKIIMYYLILAACLLAVAAITVGVIFAVRNNSITNPPAIDSGDGNKPDEGNKPDDGNNKPVDTSSMYEFIAPLKTVNLTQAHVFAYDKTMDWYRFHEGMDFSAPAGTEVFAAVDGTVKSVTRSDTLYGATVTIAHADGVTTVYKFIDPNETLKAGDKIERGNVIGKVATATGVENKDGDHLHFEVYKNNIMQDPDDYLNIISK